MAGYNFYHHGDIINRIKRLLSQQEGMEVDRLRKQSTQEDIRPLLKERKIDLGLHGYELLSKPQV